MTDTEQTDDFERVSADPAAWYSQPQDILDDPQLSLAEKTRLLEEWASDIAARSRSAGEGMVPDVPGLIDHDVKMQDRITTAQAALTGLDADRADRPVTPRLWRHIGAPAT